MLIKSPWEVFAQIATYVLVIFNVLFSYLCFYVGLNQPGWFHLGLACLMAVVYLMGMSPAEETDDSRD